MRIPASADATAEKFNALVELGDKARAERRLGDAVAAYIDALYLKDNPTVHGRVGLIAQAIRTPDLAANHLLEAVTRDGGESTAERAAFLAAYGAVRPKVCRVSMYVPVVDADILVTLDGRTVEPHRITNTYRFVMPGRHSIVVSAEGYREQRREFDAAAGGDLQLVFDLEHATPEVSGGAQDDTSAATPKGAPAGRPSASPAPAERPSAPPVPAAQPPASPAANPPPPPASRPGDKPSTWADALRVGVGAGSFLSIHRTPDVTTGAFIDASVRLPLPWFTAILAVEGRGLFPIPQHLSGSGWTADLYPSIWTAALSPCGKYKIAVACFVYEMGVRRFDGAGDVEVKVSDASTKSAGFRVGIEWMGAGRLGIAGLLEGLLPMNDYVIRVDGDPVWRSPPIFWSLSIGVVWSPGGG